MNNISFADKDTDFIATYLVGCLFGWAPEPTTDETDDLPAVEEPEFTLDANDCPEELAGYSLRESWDPEVEHDIFIGYDEMRDPVFITDDPSSVADATARWSTLGDIETEEGVPHPVTHGYSIVADYKRSAGGFSDATPTYIPGFYSAANPNGKATTRRFHAWVGWIRKYEGNTARLQVGWKRFWQQYFAAKKSDKLSTFLSAKQIGGLKSLFEKHGVSAVNKR